MLKMGERGRVDRRKDMVWAQQGFKDTSVTMFTSEGLLLDGDKKKKKRSSQTLLSYRGSLNVQLVFWLLVDREEAQWGWREFKSEDILLASGHRGPEGRFCNCWPQRRHAELHSLCPRRAGVCSVTPKSQSQQRQRRRPSHQGRREQNPGVTGAAGSRWLLLLVFWFCALGQSCSM